MTVESLTAISETDLLEKVKTGISLQGNDYQNETILFWIEQVKFYLLSAGVSADVVASTLAAGCIARGVDDYWASHREEYSDMFYQGVEHLRGVKIAGAE